MKKAIFMLVLMDIVALGTLGVAYLLNRAYVVERFNALIGTATNVWLGTVSTARYIWNLPVPAPIGYGAVIAIVLYLVIKVVKR